MPCLPQFGPIARDYSYHYHLLILRFPWQEICVNYPVYNESTRRPVPAEVIAAGGWSIDDYAWGPDPRYGMACDFLPPLEARLGFRFSF